MIHTVTGHYLATEIAVYVSTKDGRLELLRLLCFTQSPFDFKVIAYATHQQLATSHYMYWATVTCNYQQRAYANLSNSNFTSEMSIGCQLDVY